MSWLDDEIKDIEFEKNKNRPMTNRDFFILMGMMFLLMLYAINPVQASENIIPKKASEENKDYWRCRECGFSNKLNDWECWFCGEPKK